MKGQREGGDKECYRKNEMLRKRRGRQIIRDGRKVRISEEWRRRWGAAKRELRRRWAWGIAVRLSSSAAGF